MEDTTCKLLKDVNETVIPVNHSINDGTDYGKDPTLPAAHYSKRRTFRNLFFLSISYFLLFSGFWAISNLESTMNAQSGMGPDSQAIIYLFSMASCFIPELLIGKFGTKTTFAVSVLLSCPFIASNFHLRWDAVIITSILYGLASGPLNTALTVYMDEMTVRYESSSSESRENIKASFFGFYMLFAEATQILGNGVSFFVLDRGNHTYPPRNVSIRDECGIHFQSNTILNNTNLDPPSDRERFILTGTFLAMGGLAFVAALFLEPLKNDEKPVVGCSSVCQKITSAAKRLKNPHQLLLLPLTVYCGIESTFFANELTQAFIACSWGVHHVGFVTICFGVCGALMSILVGPLVKYISQMSVIILAAVINVVTCAMLFIWQPSPDTPALYFVFAGVLGVTDAIWWSQIPALYGLMFPNDREAAFSNFFFWSFFGYFISYSYANYFTVAVKINIMLVFLIVGILLFIVGQIKIKCSPKIEYVEIEESEG